jgi:hypothetical protein
MEGFGGPAQPSPTIGQCLNGGLGWFEVECNRCKTRASLPLDAIRRPRDTWLAETGSVAEMPLPANDIRWLSNEFRKWPAKPYVPTGLKRGRCYRYVFRRCFFNNVAGFSFVGPLGPQSGLLFQMIHCV